MGIQTIKKIYLGDMIAHYIMDHAHKIPELMIYPKQRENEVVGWEQKKQNIDGLIQLKILGDQYANSFSGGVSMRQSESVSRMKFKEIVVEHREDKAKHAAKQVIKTVCEDSRGYQAIHTLEWMEGDQTLESYVTFYNQSESAVSLEMLASFSMGGVTPFTSSDAHEDLYLHRIRSVWSMEGRVESDAFEDLQLEPSWAPGGAVRSERFGEVGSMPVNRFFPFAVIEDKKNQVFWGAQIAHNASWQMEVYRKDESASFSGGLADRELGQWVKEIKPGESFTTPLAILTTACGMDFDHVAQRLTSYQKHSFEFSKDYTSKELPIIFNEYCTTWGSPSHKNICEILDAIKDKGFKYFVIDAGWYKKEGKNWAETLGDYLPSQALFPEGLDKTTEAIHSAGMKAGLWFEVENVGNESDAYQMEEHLLKRDGLVLATTARRFWDMRQPWVQAHLTDTIIGTLKKYQFDYIKIDYNDTIGIGCDGAESLGEGLRQNMEASYQFIKKLRNEIPDITIENCASGGHRLEPKMMGITSMASFSDAHECPEIPVIAANVHRVILPFQSQIWAVVRKTDSLKRIAYSLANTFLGRLCLSGDVVDLNAAQWRMVDEGIKFYKEISAIIKNGTTSYFGNIGKSWRHLQGWQGILRENEKEAYVVFHTFDGELPEDISVSWNKKYDYKIQSVYSDTEVDIHIEENKLVYKPKENMKAVAIHLKK